MDEKAARKADEKRRKARLLEKHRVDRAIAETLATPDGRLMLWHFLELCGYGAQPHTGNALNTAFKCGELNVGLQIVARLGEVDPASFVRMQHERLTDDLSNRTDTDAASSGTYAPDADSTDSDGTESGW